VSKKSKSTTIPSVAWEAFGCGQPVPEFKFHPDRKWRCDYAWPEQRLVVEIEGGIWTGGRHTSGAGFTQDMEKYNALAELGYRILRYPPSKRGRFGVDFDQVRRALNHGQKTS